METFNQYQKTTIKRIKAITKRLEKELGLKGFIQVRHVFDAGMDGDTTTPTDSPTLFGTCAVTTPTWNYRYAQIRWYLSMASDATTDTLEQVAIHEYVHILVHPITQLISSDELGPREEYATESIARAICHARGMKNIH